MTCFSPQFCCKLVHGADWDVQWLQRDFCIYVVNLFDTGQASRMLNLPRYSFAFLLQYCYNVQADKQYQLMTGGYGLSNHLSVRLSVHLSVYLSIWLFVRQRVIKSANYTLVIYKTLSLLLFLLSQTTTSGTCQVRPRRHSLLPLHL